MAEVKKLIPKEKRCGNCKLFELDECPVDKIAEGFDNDEYFDADAYNNGEDDDEAFVFDEFVFDDVTLNDVDKTLQDTDVYDLCVITALLGCESCVKKE